jgi:GNAT superfamily N-acetyltransferase
VNEHVLALANDPNTHTPLRTGDERIVDPRFVIWVGLGTDSPGWTVVQRFRFEPDEIDAVVDDVHELLRQRGRTSCTWEVGTTGRPEGLVDMLLARGMVPAERDSHQTGMVLRQEPAPIPAGIEVRRAETLDDYASAEAIAHVAFGEPPPSDEYIAAMFERRNPEVVRRYLARADGADIGTATATFARHGVVLYSGSTLPEHRGRGAYRALVRARWDDAVAAGTPVLVTHAGSMSRPILERLGFQAVSEIVAVVDRFAEPGPAPT